MTNIFVVSSVECLIDACAKGNGIGYNNNLLFSSVTPTGNLNGNIQGGCKNGGGGDGKELVI